MCASTAARITGSDAHRACSAAARQCRSLCCSLQAPRRSATPTLCTLHTSTHWARLAGQQLAGLTSPSPARLSARPIRSMRASMHRSCPSGLTAGAAVRVRQRAGRQTCLVTRAHTCRRCKQQFAGASDNGPSACRYHPDMYTGGEVAKVGAGPPAGLSCWGLLGAAGEPPGCALLAAGSRVRATERRPRAPAGRGDGQDRPAEVLGLLWVRGGGGARVPAGLAPDF